LGSCDAAQLFERHQTRARISLAIFEQLMRPVCADGDGVKLESETRGVQLRVKMSGLLRSLHSAGDSADPFVHDGCNAVAHDAEAPIKLERSSGEKASSLEDSFLDERQPVINQRPQARHAFRRSDGRERHFIYENLAGHFNSG
jgi:hypothetical protein